MSSESLTEPFVALMGLIANLDALDSTSFVILGLLTFLGETFDDPVGDDLFLFYSSSSTGVTIPDLVRSLPMFNLLPRA